MDKPSRGKFLLIPALAVFAAGVLAKVNSPLVEWDGVFFEVAKNWASGVRGLWVLDYTPLYTFFLVLPFRLLGAAPETARLCNALPVLAAAWLVYLTAKNLSGRRAGIAAASLYLLSPVTIQGIQSLAGSDTSLLPLCFALIAYVLSRPPGETRARAFALSFVFTLALWAKTSSSIAVVAGCFLYLPAFRGRIERDFFRTTAIGISGGILLFILTWSAFSIPEWGVEAWVSVLVTPFRYFPQAAPSWDGGIIFKWGLDLVRVVFWFSPFLVYLAFSAIRDIFRSKVSTGASHLLAFLCAFYFAGHIFIGGSNHGFPRYHAAISPLLHVFAGIAFAGIPGRLAASQRWNLIVPAFLFPVIIVAYADPELLLNLRLKQLTVAGDYQGVFIQVFAPLFAFTALPFAAGALFNKIFSGKNFNITAIAAASAALFGACSALALRQGLAAYSTQYQYGASGKAGVVELVAGKLSGGETLMATPEFIYALRPAEVYGPGWKVWQSENGIYNFISEREPAFIIAGWTTHTRAQLKYFLQDEKIRNLLEKKYVLSEMGTYFVWKNRRLSDSKTGTGI